MAKRPYALSLYLPQEVREDLHALEGELLSDTGERYSANELVRVALAMALDKRDRFKREAIRRRSADESSK